MKKHEPPVFSRRSLFGLAAVATAAPLSLGLAEQKIGRSVHVRLPSDYKVVDTVALSHDRIRLPPASPGVHVTVFNHSERPTIVETPEGEFIIPIGGRLERGDT